MTLTDLRALRVGDIVMSKADGKGYVVTDVHGDRATAVRSVDVTDPTEWEVFPMPPFPTRT